jgi:DNA polymerase III epsilon subunit-like protein
MLYTVLDLESTGYHKEGGDEILSFGFMRINSQFEIKASGTLYFYKPNFDVGKYPACTVHKLKREFMQQHEYNFKDNIKKMYSLCYKSTIIGKNSTTFDMPFIKNFIKRHCPTLDELQYLKTFDIQSEFSGIYRERTGAASNKKGTLTDYLDCLNITQEDVLKVYQSLPTKDETSLHMHGALYDCVATFMVFRELCSILKIKP